MERHELILIYYNIWYQNHLLPYTQQKIPGNIYKSIDLIRA